ncbi:MAG: hypothetical protein QM529_05230 [Hydrotalea sp.]|nr:hypothetical protein [Hydrotalea sp.]
MIAEENKQALEASLKDGVKKASYDLSWVFVWPIMILLFAFLWQMIARVSNSKVPSIITNTSDGAQGNALAAIQGSIETFQLYIVLFTIILGVISFLGFQEVVRRAENVAESKAKEAAEKMAERIANEKVSAFLEAKKTEEDARVKTINAEIESLGEYLGERIDDLEKRIERLETRDRADIIYE